MALTEELSLYLVIGCLLGLAGWTQRKKITYRFSFWSFLIIVIGWPGVLAWTLARSIFPGHNKSE